MCRPRPFLHHHHAAGSFRGYLVEQLRLIMRNHGMPVSVGESQTPIPLHFAFLEGTYVDGSIADRLKRPIRDIFDVPNLEGTDDHIANGTFEVMPGEARPLAPLHRAAHRLLAAPPVPLYRDQPGAFPELRAVTNYQFYVDEFCVHAAPMMASGAGGLRPSSSRAM